MIGSQYYWCVRNSRMASVTTGMGGRAQERHSRVPLTDANDTRDVVVKAVPADRLQAHHQAIVVSVDEALRYSQYGACSRCVRQRVSCQNCGHDALSSSPVLHRTVHDITGQYRDSTRQHRTIHARQDGARRYRTVQGRTG